MRACRIGRGEQPRQIQVAGPQREAVAQRVASRARRERRDGPLRERGGEPATQRAGVADQRHDDDRQRIEEPLDLGAIACAREHRPERAFEARRVAVRELELGLEVAGGADQDGAWRGLAIEAARIGRVADRNGDRPRHPAERLSPARVAMHDPEFGHERPAAAGSPRARRGQTGPRGTRGKRRASGAAGLGRVQSAGTDRRKRASPCPNPTRT
jgi:hypothetical protein